jgi:hypothetical protein
LRSGGSASGSARRFSPAAVAALLGALLRGGGNGGGGGGGGAAASRRSSSCLGEAALVPVAPEGGGAAAAVEPPAPPSARPPLYPAPPSARAVPARSTAASMGFFVEGLLVPGSPAAPPPSPAPPPAPPPPLRQVPGVLALSANAFAAFVNAAARLRGAARAGGRLAAYLPPGGGAAPLRMGFGLHAGWAIEGAIGTQLKWDYSYLSPAVNVASRLENACRVYGVDLVLSRAFLLCLPVEVVRMLRRVDRVRMKGVAEPLELFTFDWDGAAAEALLRGGGVRYQEPPPRPPGGTGAGAGAPAAPPRAPPRAWAAPLQQLEDLHRLQPPGAFPQAFMEHCQRAVECYLGDAGGGAPAPAPNWALARHHAEEALKVRPADGPLRALLRTLDELGAVGEDGAWGAPKGWPGFRVMGKA